MRRLSRFAMISALCGSSALAQSPPIPKLAIPSGAIIPLQLQSRLNPSETDPADGLPTGTKLLVRILEPVDSRFDADVSAFYGILASPLQENGHVLIPAGAEASGLFVLLRSQRHPEGFRYDLLITNLIDHGKSYVVTASLSPSLSDSGSANR